MYMYIYKIFRNLQNAVMLSVVIIKGATINLIESKSDYKFIYCAYADIWRVIFLYVTYADSKIE